MTPAEVAEISAYAKAFKQRLGQYIENAMVTQTDNNYDLFYIPDNMLLKACRDYFAHYKERV